MDTVRGDAKTAAFADLGADHRAKVQSIVDGFDADGSTMTVADGAKAIDAILSAGETKTVLAEEQKMRDAMRAALAVGGPGGGMFGGRGMRRRTPDAGRFLLQVASSPDRFRSAMRAERGAQPPPNGN